MDIDIVNTTKKNQDGILIFSPSKDYRISADHYEKFLNQNKNVQIQTVMSSGNNLRTGLTKLNVPKGTALELGCGAGAGSRPIVASNYFSNYIITDGSADLSKITRESITSLGLQKSENIFYGTLLDYDLNIFPRASLSAIFLIAALHHFEDWRGTLRTCLESLQPGGIIFFVDPCLETNFALSPIFLSFESIYRQKNPGVSNDFFKPMRQLIGATKFRGNPHAPDKHVPEDKHFFQIKDIYEFAQDEDVVFHYFPNSGLANFSQQGIPPKQDFFKFTHRVLKNNQHFSDELLDAFFIEMKPQLEFLNYFWSAGQGPVSSFTGVIQRRHEETL